MSELDLSNYNLTPTNVAITQAKEELAGVLGDSFNASSDTQDKIQNIVTSVASAYATQGEHENKYGLVFTALIAHGVYIFLYDFLLPEIRAKILEQHIKEYEAGNYTLQQKL